jgi:HSP20 family protein
MDVSDLIPWRRDQNVTVRRGGEGSPFLALHREMNRLFDDVFRDIGPFSLERFGDRSLGWPRLEVNDSDQEVKVVAELPGLEEKDVQVELANGVLTIKGEKQAETEDKDRLFSERYYGRFERRIPIDDVAEDKITATFKNGLLTVILPKSVKAQEKVRRISINPK